PHLSVVQTVKEHFPPRRFVSCDSSAAEKRDYVTLTHFRQALQQNIFYRTTCFTSSPASPETPAPQGRCAFYPSQKTRQPPF
ncbi:hypothetical protein, partial [Azonexus sp.]|uniref:hypothetical protein n=1 Tax=Azonexus sp. TaxID=1872668 RepID=UPI0027BA35CC